MHYIQSKILDKLNYTSILRYSQLRPLKIESNHFAYHLKILVRDGYVVKNDNGYSLSPKGKFYVDRISHISLKVRQQPKIVTLLEVSNSKNQLAIIKRKNQPFIDMYAHPVGKLHIGESVFDCAKREALEKLGVSDVKLKHRGNVYICIREQGEVVSHVLAHVFYGQTKMGFPLEEHRALSRHWIDKQQVDSLTPTVPGFKEIRKMLDSKKNSFFEELFFDSR